MAVTPGVLMVAVAVVGPPLCVRVMQALRLQPRRVTAARRASRAAMRLRLMGPMPGAEVRVVVAAAAVACSL